MVHPIHWTQEEKNAAQSQGILNAIKENGKAIAESTEARAGDNAYTHELLEEIRDKEFPEIPEPPTEMAVTLKGVSVVSIKGDKGDRGRSPLVVSETEPVNPEIGDLWYKP